jgi:long-chain acyl-CoA synthetase
MYKELKEAWGEMTAAGQMFEIVEKDIRGQSLKAFANAPATLRDMWQMSAGYADSDYLVYQDERWTYAEAHDEVNRIANWLVANGVQQHDRVAIAMRNFPEWMLSYWAITSIGASVVGMNAWWVTDEMEYGLQDAAPVLMICDQERWDRFAPIQSEFKHLKVVGVRLEGDVPAGVIEWSEVLKAEPKMPEVEIDGDDDACIFYTSGTTGRPKGAQLTHLGCTNNVMGVVFANMVQGAAMDKVQAASGEEAPEDKNPLAGGPPASIISTPLFHVTANNCVAQAMTVGGGKLVHMYKWDAGEALRIIEEEKISVFTGVPVMAREMINHPDFAKRDTSSLKSLGGGGAPVQPDLVDKIDKSEGEAAPSQGYGMTEVCGVIAAHGGAFFVDKPASAGIVMPTFEVKCVDEDDNEVAQGERGEVCVKGVQVIKGYLNRVDATAESIVDGWLHTGDIGYLDEEGFLFLVDRAKDMVLRGGENVYCSEVETAIFSHAAIAEASVFSVPDERLGEEVGVAIFLQSGAELTGDELRDFLKIHLSAYKIPRYIWFTAEALPRNASGKFLKKELQKILNVSDAA